ncbi:hypothetical protein [Leucobacter musarum]|nr:hypothetical protein [Leucobacter musarum]
MPPDQITGIVATSIALTITAAVCFFAAWKLGHLSTLLQWLGFRAGH